jgi:hypothetical protein
MTPQFEQQQLLLLLFLEMAVMSFNLGQILLSHSKEMRKKKLLCVQKGCLILLMANFQLHTLYGT